MKRQMIIPGIIGVGLSAMGGALLFVDAWNEMGHATGSLFESLLSLSWQFIWWPVFFTGTSSVGATAGIILATLFWAGMAYGFIEGNKKANTSPQIPEG